MSNISWYGQVMADVRLSRIAGQKVAGGFGLRLGLEFNVVSWTANGCPPRVLLLPAVVLLAGSEPLILGRAFPEVPQPVVVNQYSSSRTGVQFDIVLSPAAMEVLERVRNGAGVTLQLKLQAELRRDAEVLVDAADLSATFSVSDWLVALEQCGYGRSILFEVPVPSHFEEEVPWAKVLESARANLYKGHYAQCVAECRLVLESLTKELGQEDTFKTAKAQQKTDRTKLSVDQRELVLRQAAVDYASLAHHVDAGVPAEVYDRRSAQMLLAIVAALVASALARHVDSERLV